MSSHDTVKPYPFRVAPMTDELAGLAEYVPVGVYLTDAVGRCLYVNARWCEFTGLSREQALGDGWSQAIHPEDRKSTFENWKRGRLGGSEFVDEFRIQRPDGTVRMVSSQAMPVFDDQRRLTGYLGTATDITERHQSKEELRKLADTLGIRVRELDCLFGIARLVEEAGGSLERVLQGTVSLLPPAWQHSDIARARIVMNGREYRSQNFFDCRWKQTADIVVGGNRSGVIEVGYLEEKEIADEGPFLKEERTLINTIAARLGQIAEHIETAHELRAQQAELRERMSFVSRVTTMGEMASNIAHELNQPLTTISSFAEACMRRIQADTASTPKVLDMLSRIGDEALRAGDIIRHMRELVEKRQSHRVESDINELVRYTLSLATADAHLHDVHLCLDLSNSLPRVLVDHVQLHLVILNLMRNSIDAIEASGFQERNIVVGTTLNTDDEIEVSVADTGCGVPDPFGEEIFDPFFTTKENGTGLGLAISRSIVTAHGGRIWYRQNPDRGATFTFVIPTAGKSDRDPR
jgi:PAS domain S-box-containing protein